jgi:Kef-type K+ transport system membrane component KefB
VSFTDADLARLLVALAVLLIAAHGMGSLFAKLGQPPAIGEILGGILLGPTLLATVAPGVAHWIFPKDGVSAAALGAVYQLGLLLLMFAAGTEMRKLLQRSNVRTVSLIAGFGMVLPFAAGLGLVAALGVKDYIGPAGNHTALILVFGMAVAVTSIPVISRIMHDLHLLPTRFARMVLSAAVVEDIVLYVVLAVAVGLVQPKGSSAFGLPGALKIHTVTQNSVYHTIIAVIFLAIALGSAAAPTGPCPACVSTRWPAAARSHSSCCGCWRCRPPRSPSDWCRCTERSPQASRWRSPTRAWPARKAGTL